MTALLKYSTVCLNCGHPISAMSDAALTDLKAEHARYIDRTVDRRTDPHFADARLQQLIES